MDRNKKGSGGKLLACLFGSLFLAQANAATVSFSPATDSVGGSFSIDIVGNGFNDGDLDGWGLDLTFDETVVNVVSVVVDAAWDFVSNNGTISNVAGTVNDIQGSTFSSVNGDNIALATINFQAVGQGLAGLGFTEDGTNPFATGGNAYPNLTLDDSNTIQVVPVPAAAWLFASGLLGLLGVRRRLQIN